MQLLKACSTKIDQASKGCEKIGTYISITYGVLVFLLVFSGIILRLLFTFQSQIGVDLIRPFPWSEELSRWLLIALTFISSSVALKKGEHVGIELIVGKMPKISRKIVSVTTSVLILIFLGICLYTTFTVALQGVQQTGDVIPLSMIWVKIHLPLGFAFMMIHTLSYIIQEVVCISS